MVRVELRVEFRSFQTNSEELLAGKGHISQYQIFRNAGLLLTRRPQTSNLVWSMTDRRAKFCTVLGTVREETGGGRGAAKAQARERETCTVAQCPCTGDTTRWSPGQKGLWRGVLLGLVRLACQPHAVRRGLAEGRVGRPASRKAWSRESRWERTGREQIRRCDGYRAHATRWQGGAFWVSVEGAENKLNSEDRTRRGRQCRYPRGHCCVLRRWCGQANVRHASGESYPGLRHARGCYCRL